GVGGGLFGASQAKRISTLDFATNVAKTGGTCLGKTPDPRCATIDSMARQVDTFHNAAVGAFIGASALAVATVTYVLWPAPKATKSARRMHAPTLTPILGAERAGMAVSGAF